MTWFLFCNVYHLISILDDELPIFLYVSYITQYTLLIQDSHPWITTIYRLRADPSAQNGTSCALKHVKNNWVQTIQKHNVQLRVPADMGYGVRAEEFTYLLEWNVRKNHSLNLGIFCAWIPFLEKHPTITTHHHTSSHLCTWFVHPKAWILNPSSSLRWTTLSPRAKVMVMIHLSMRMMTCWLASSARMPMLQLFWRGTWKWFARPCFRGYWK